MRQFILSAILMALLAVSTFNNAATAQSFYQLWYNNAPVSNTNLLPTSATLAAGSLIGVKGVDGNSIATGANPLPTAPDGSTVTNKHAAITANTTVQTVTLSSSCRHLTIWTSSGSPDLTVSFTGVDPGAAEGVVLYGGAALKQDLGAPISSFKYVGVSGAGVINYVAQ